MSCDDAVETIRHGSGEKNDERETMLTAQKEIPHYRHERKPDERDQIGDAMRRQHDHSSDVEEG